MGTKVILGVIGAVVLIAIVLGLSVVGPYNTLVRLDQAVQAQWAQVENVYQRRADLVPNLVETVKSHAEHRQRSCSLPAVPTGAGWFVVSLVATHGCG